MTRAIVLFVQRMSKVFGEALLVALIAAAHACIQNRWSSR